MKRAAPTWTSSANKDAEDQLYLFNSLTRQKEVFKTIDGKQLKWYSCGPTVYDESHMGHARCYISTDIIRRVLQDYFKFDITYCMNITDIDDKIIIRARKRYLYDEYLTKIPNLKSLIDDVNEAYALTEKKAQEEPDKDKKEMYNKMLIRVRQTIDDHEKKKNGNGNEEPFRSELLASASEILMTWLDKKHGKNVTDNSIFASLPRHYEAEFHKDMTALNILPPNVLTRVSEYVPEIIDFIKKIIDNGFGYVSNGSVYFDTVKFDKNENHYYAKLLPEAFGDSKALAEGEGELFDGQEKLNPTDFALWKSSKPGEPAWDSPWGKGRPGWHIECSAMAGAIFGAQIDIHSGGQDLKFPHHDNEIAQSEAHYGNNNWCNFFVHSGHLHIQGCKMSKSLKNFITIKQALQKYTSRQIRILFLLHTWKDTLDFSDQAMSGAVSFEKTCKEFFYKVKDFSRDAKFEQPTAFTKFTPVEIDLLNAFKEKKLNIHRALCDSVNTPVVMKEILNLISTANNYMSGYYNSKHYNHILMRDIGNYITDLLRIFGAIEANDQMGFANSNSSGESSNFEEKLMPYLTALSKFRDDVRNEARLNKQTPILNMCDNLRDNVLPDLGVLMEDLADRTVVKLCDRETILREREQKLKMAELKKAEELKRKKELEDAKREKEAKKSINPKEMFLKETDKYSKFDEDGIPVLDAEGKELSKSARKKCEKAYELQKKSYDEYLKQKGAINGIEP